MIKMSRKLDMLMRELKKSNAETYFHSLRTKKYTSELINVLNNQGVTAYSADDTDMICKGAVLHDVGKLKVRNVILTKDDILTDEEKDAIQMHAEWSYELVKNELNEFEHDVICDICRYHHERIDGSGYNSMIDLPMYVQIVSICDVFDALHSDRIYRMGMSKEKSMCLIKDGQCGKFDEILIESLQKVIDNVLE